MIKLRTISRSLSVKILIRAFSTGSTAMAISLWRAIAIFSVPRNEKNLSLEKERQNLAQKFSYCKTNAAFSKSIQPHPELYIMYTHWTDTVVTLSWATPTQPRSNHHWKALCMSTWDFWEISRYKAQHIMLCYYKFFM